MKTYISIRVVRAKSNSQAVKKIFMQDFDEGHPLCDRVLTVRDAITQLIKWINL